MIVPNGETAGDVLGEPAEAPPHKLVLDGVSVTSATVAGGSASIVFSDDISLTLTGVTSLAHLQF